MFRDGGGPAGPVRVGPVVRDETSMPTHQIVSGFTRKIDQRSRPSTRASAVRTARSSGSNRGRGPGVAARRVGGAARGSRRPWNDRAAASTRQVDHETDKTVETRHAPILAASEPRRSPQRETVQESIQNHTPSGGITLVIVTYADQAGARKAFGKAYKQEVAGSSPAAATHNPWWGLLSRALTPLA